VPVFTWEEFLQMGKDNPSDPDPPTADEYSTYMYTSGTTGDPKGVMLSHKSLMYMAAAIQVCILQLLWMAVCPGTRFVFSAMHAVRDVKRAMRDAFSRRRFAYFARRLRSRTSTSSLARATRSFLSCPWRTFSTASLRRLSSTAAAALATGRYVS
jgi:acyl-CoA synthetase (AMP-forming)/AMP-acid ligase II